MNKHDEDENNERLEKCLQCKDMFKIGAYRGFNPICVNCRKKRNNKTRQRYLPHKNLREKDNRLKHTDIRNVVHDHVVHDHVVRDHVVRDHVVRDHVVRDHVVRDNLNRNNQYSRNAPNDCFPPAKRQRRDYNSDDNPHRKDFNHEQQVPPRERRQDFSHFQHACRAQYNQQQPPPSREGPYFQREDFQREHSSFRPATQIPHLAKLRCLVCRNDLVRRPFYENDHLVYFETLPCNRCSG